MKGTLIFLLLLTFMVGSSFAGPNTYIGLYTDEYHSSCSATVPAAYVGFNIWVWILPSDQGMICAEYAIDLPTEILIIGSVLHPNHTPALPGCTPQACSVCFSDCQYNWQWLAQFSALPTHVTETEISVIAHPESGGIRAANCSEGYPIVPVTVLNHLGVNRPCDISVQSDSWGAVKSLYTE